VTGQALFSYPLGMYARSELDEKRKLFATVCFTARTFGDRETADRFDDAIRLINRELAHREKQDQLLLDLVDPVTPE
jgi:hypothetical protein